MLIREAVHGDYEAVHRLHQQVHRAHVEARPDLFVFELPTLDRSLFWSLISDHLTKVLLLVNEKQKIVAYAIVRFIDIPKMYGFISRRTLYVTDLCVDEKIRGAGYGKLFFEKISDFAKRHHVDALELDVYAWNVKAQGFYYQMGMSSQKMTMEYKITPIQ
ncbi:GNAT family N-acetyltransferase [Halalkalibacterium ligniniphilum]|uniref:GNAT family N-acetyltransferase n=1 Tax=Halalkalibacterium ligniniphilum TaxID=1134413 RepID=UPI00034D58D0|nr:GNAT family N-acetyltransferase [Halalkalibacterium ligniniphilum]